MMQIIKSCLPDPPFPFCILQNICRSLFSDHTLIFSFILCAGILGRRPGLIQQNAWAFFLTGRGRHDPGDEASFLEDKPSFLSEKSWRQLVDAEGTLAEFEGISRHVREMPEEWRAFCFADDPYVKPAPGKWNSLRQVHFMTDMKVHELNCGLSNS